MALEKTITNKIMTESRREGWLVYKLAGGSFQTAGLPDVLLMKSSRTVFLEVKRPGGKATPLQLHHIAKIRDAGHTAEVVTSWDQAQAILENV